MKVSLRSRYSELRYYLPSFTGFFAHGIADRALHSMGLGLEIRQALINYFQALFSPQLPNGDQRGLSYQFKSLFRDSNTIS